jgi:Peptidase C10 family/Spi protease inhibitor/CUB domain
VKKIYPGLLGLFWLVGLPVFGQPIPFEKAAKVAQHVAGRQLGLRPLITRTQVRTQGSDTLFYVFDLDKQGFVMVSAEASAHPLLGYGSGGPFPDLKTLPSHIDGWMQGYTQQLAVARAFPVAEIDPEIAQAWRVYTSPVSTNTAYRVEAMAPLIQAKWDQPTPYNALCPIATQYDDDDRPTTERGRALVGCVAVAMGLIMHYYQYPAQGNGSFAYTPRGVGTQLSANFGTTSYDWANMPNRINANSAAAQRSAVSTLLYHAGVAVAMDYGPSGSGAFVAPNPARQRPNSRDAMVNYFRFASSARAVYRSQLGAQWEATLRQQLDRRQPILYAGSGSTGGHAFVCDGYADDGTFSFNWGWSGFCDGFYRVARLRPANQTNQRETDLDYTENQHAIIDLVPLAATDNAPQLSLFPNTTQRIPAGASNFNLEVRVRNLTSWQLGTNSNVQGITASQTTGTATATVRLSFPANTGAAARNIEIVATAGSLQQSVMFVQEGTAATNLSINPSANQNLGAEAGRVTLQINANLDWQADATATNLDRNFPWVRYESDASGTGNGSVVFSYQANPSNAPRSFTVTVRGQTASVERTITYTQAGSSGIQIRMQNGSSTTCQAFFTDGGGEAGEYGNNERRTLTLAPATPGQRVRVSFREFRLEDDYDFLSIYDGASTSARLIGRYTGTAAIPQVTATNAAGQLTFVFESDESVTETGWVAAVSCVAAPATANTVAMSNGGQLALCSGTYTDDGGANPYRSSLTLVQTLVPTAANQRVRLTFAVFDLENGYDFLEVYDGASTTATRLGRYTGATLPPVLTASNPTGALTLRFTSDASVVRPGFEAAVSCVAGPGQPALTATIQANGPTSFCDGGSVGLAAVSPPANATFQWLNNNAALAGATQASFTATQPGSYTLRITVGAQSAVSNAVAVSLVNSGLAAPSLTASATDLCEGQAVSVSAPAGFEAYDWAGSSVGVTGAAFNGVLPAGAHTFRVVVRQGGCSSPASALLTVRVQAAPRPVIRPTNVSPTTPNPLLVSSVVGAPTQWFRNGQAIAGATTATFQISEAGAYTVRVSYPNGCTVTSEPLAVTALEADPARQGLKLYPNPAEAAITVEWAAQLAPGAHLTVYNALGQPVWRPAPGPAVGLQQQIPTAAWAAGMYYLRFEYAQGSLVVPFVKN